MSHQYIVNGITYDNLDEMPPDVRASFEMMGNLFADKNQNGVPDVVEDAMQQTPLVVSTGATVSPSPPQISSTPGLGPIIVLGIISIVLAITLGILLWLLIVRGRGG